MRVTQFTQYNNFVIDQQKTLSELDQVQTQIATGEKIQNMYEDPVVYTKYLNFNEEINSFTQIKSSANFAQTFANETDTTLNDFVTTLGSFKTNLLKAANATNDDTSREAIANELEGELAHLKDLANTSIDGKYIFSGSKFSVKPIDDNYQYQGNDAKVKAYLGAGVEREYNIDGESLFLGRDNDYSKHITMNVVQYDKMKANPEFVVRGKDGKLYIDKDITAHGKQPDSDNPPENVPVTGDSQIRMLTGVSDVYNASTDTYSDGTSYFYVKGKRPDGSSFNEKFSLKNSDTVNDLLQKIGEIYGNTPTSKVVDVSVNSMGEIQVKDVQTGKMLTDFYMAASDKDENSVQDLVKNGDYIVEFQKSNFDTIRNGSEITASNKYFDNRIFKFGSEFKTVDTKRNALPTDTLDNVLGNKGVRESDGTIQPLDHLELSGTDTNGNSVDVTLNVTSTTTMNDLMNEIKNNFGDVDVNLENGELVVTDKSIEKTQHSKLSLKIDAYDAGGNSLDVFSSKDSVNFGQIYMKKDGNEINSNVSQIVKDYKTVINNGETEVSKNPDAQTYAKDDTTIMDTAGNDTLPKDIKIKYRDINGALKTAKVELTDTPQSVSAVYENDGNSRVFIDPNNKSTVNSKLFDIIGSSVTTGTDGSKTDIKYLKISDGSTTDEIAVNSDTTIQDIINSSSLITGYSNGAFTTSDSNVTISLEDENKNTIQAEFMSNYQIDVNNDGKITYGEMFNIYAPDGSLTPAHDTFTTKTTLDTSTCEVCKENTLQKGVTYRQLGDVVSMLTSDNVAAGNDSELYNNSVNTAKGEVESGMDSKGRFYVKDNSNNPSKIDLSMYTDDNSLYFQANDAVTVDEPQVDFFKTLQNAIEAVKNGNNYADSNADDPRNSGIQGAIEAIDHVTDHVRREHAKIGAVSNEFKLTIERTDMLKLNVQQLQSDNIDTDLGEASMKLNSLKTSYQALLASIAKVNNLTLLNYL